LASFEDYSQKKTLCVAEQRRADGVKEREEWQTFPEFVDEATLVVIDETWAKTNMAPLYNQAPLRRR
jgi:hypothetical protein